MAVSVPTMSHSGLFLALNVYLRRTPAHHNGHRFIRAYANSVKFAADHSCVSGWVFTWYSAGSAVHGRVQDRTPGMLSLPSALRWAFFGAGRTRGHVVAAYRHLRFSSRA